MKNLIKKVNWAVGLSSFTLLVVVAIVGLWIFQTKEYAVVSLDTFVGVIVALLAIIVTIAIGWQIYAAMDLRANIAKLDSRIQAVENIKNKLSEQEDKMKQLHYEAQHFSQLAIAETCNNKHDYVNAFRFYMSSLSCGLQLTSPMNLQPLLDAMSGCTQAIVEQTNLKDIIRKDILINDQTIRASHLFGVVQSRYEQVYSEFKSKVKLNDDQK